MRYDCIIVGAGAAGLLAAGYAGLAGLSVLLVEKNERPARKVLITGKGRCNVTNNCLSDDFLRSVRRNPRFLLGAVHTFAPADLMQLFEETLNVPLKTERGNRVFPVSDRAVDIVDALHHFAKKNGAQFLQGRCERLLTQPLEVIDQPDRLPDEQQAGNKGKKAKKNESPSMTITGIRLEDGREFSSSLVLLATGGMSYPQTGSTGDGYRIAQAVGHTIQTPVASLVPIVCSDKCCRDLMGVSLRNVELTVTDQQNGKKVFEELGEMLFTHFGVSGPLVLSASSHMQGEISRYSLSIDLKPGLDIQKLDARLLRDFETYQNKDFLNALGDLLPRKLIPQVVQRSGIPGEMKVHQITKEMRQSLIEVLKGFTLRPTGFRPIEEAIVTSGGVEVNEVNPKTMQSKIVQGLFFAGELLDVDGYTGGYNLQIAFSTGYAAAKGMAGSVSTKGGR